MKAVGWILVLLDSCLLLLADVYLLLISCEEWVMRL
mgnify:CR=1 FL=1